jgi:hypothetical protein
MESKALSRLFFSHDILKTINGGDGGNKDIAAAKALKGNAERVYETYGVKADK